MFRIAGASQKNPKRSGFPDWIEIIRISAHPYLPSPKFSFAHIEVLQKHRNEVF